MSKDIFITKPLLPKISEFNKGLEDIWESKILTNNGPNLQKLEEKLEEFLKIRNLVIYNNATIALLATVKSLELKGEVITTPFTFSATIHALAWNNITPIFCDIDPKTYCIDPNKIESLITEKTSAIMGVHVYGIPCDTKKIEAIAKKHKLKVIYDAAHAFNTKVDNQSILTKGDASILSFHATKLFNTVEGGAVIVKDKNLKEKLILLRNFGIKNEEEVLDSGINGKMNEIQALIGLLNLEIVNEEIKKREKILQHYKNSLKNIKGISFFEFPSNITNSYQYFPIFIDQENFGISRNELYKKFKENNIHVRKYFYPLCSNYECYKNLESSKKEKLPIANKKAEEVLCLPFYGDLTESDVEKICKIILSAKNKV